MYTLPFLSTQGVISYLVIDDQKNAILIDPSFDSAQKIVLKLKQDGLNLKYILDTHTHADFFSSRALFKALYPGAKVGLSKLSPTKDNELMLENGSSLELNNLKLTAHQSNGHTGESMIFVFEQTEQAQQPIAILTGDALLIGGTGRTDFQVGDSATLFDSLKYILELPDTTIIYPGHNYQGQTKTTLGVEKITNPRLKLVLEGKRADFVNLLDSHHPPKPDLFDESLAWNSI